MTTKGVGYTNDPTITISAVADHVGAGAQNGSCTMAGQPATITSAASIGTSAGTLAVVA